jgi:beta-lactamase class A
MGKFDQGQNLPIENETTLRFQSRSLRSNSGSIARRRPLNATSSRGDGKATLHSLDRSKSDRKFATSDLPQRSWNRLIPLPFQINFRKPRSERRLPIQSPLELVKEATLGRPQRRERRRLDVMSFEDRPFSGRQRQRSSRPSLVAPLPAAYSSSTAQSTPRPATVPVRPRTRSGLALLYGTRLLILGVGIGVIAGTFLSMGDPASHSTAGAQTEKSERVATAPSPPALPALELSQEMLPLKNQIASAIAPLTQLTPGVMVVDLDTHAFLDINASTAFASASTIKFPVLVAFFQDVDAGKIRLNEMLTMRQDLIATESGELQYQPVGSQFSALEVITKMITVSDNTATNMIIDRLGGKDVLNQRFQAWGLANTAIRNPLPDLNGTNTSSPKDMVTLMNLVSSGQMVSLRSQERMMDIMRRVITDTLLPRGLGEGATIAHKTGDIGTMVGDTGIVDMPTGKRYLITVMVKRPFNDGHAQELIRQISTLTYQYLDRASKQSPASPTLTQETPTQGNQNPAASPAPDNQTTSPGNSQGATITRFKVAQP